MDARLPELIERATKRGATRHGMTQVAIMSRSTTPDCSTRSSGATISQPSTQRSPRKPRRSPGSASEPYSAGSDPSSGGSDGGGDVKAVLGSE
jgi:hypothetical protein